MVYKLCVIIILLIISFFLPAAGATESGPAGAMAYGGRRCADAPAQLTVERKYAQYRLPEHAVSFNKFCYPSAKVPQPSQRLAGQLVAPGSKLDTLLVFHKIGSGKTCTGIQIAERWTSLGRPAFLLPASLEPSLRDELRDFCPDKPYVRPDDSAALADPAHPDYMQAMSRSDRLIDRTYQIYSYNKFVALAGKIRAPILIIDEFQNINNIRGQAFAAVMNFIEKNPGAKIVIMSATPIFDNLSELQGIFRLLKIDISQAAGPADISNWPAARIGKLLGPHTSYFKGAPDKTFPRAIVKILPLKMSKFQAQWYSSEVAREQTAMGNLKTITITNNFYIKSRQRADMVFPNGLDGPAGLGALSASDIRNKLGTASCL